MSFEKEPAGIRNAYGDMLGGRIDVGKEEKNVRGKFSLPTWRVQNFCTFRVRTKANC